ncbi:hypothetical protein Cs7R123_49670 [Catellatospora sp. TT07R-123]|uniref:TlpA family protein disulfide reductase n=1 Tax=Catellatospora sp. TT07R-123 TaxID=2733863 RepID=UPI001B230C8E|nr:TlpA disulfide reductase family protein [Catellatospora sp. TT07R-123]GHJ47625.1 hypothetical protein Cs7R123_49670 [Catellatospora sp. TT07R-123]
MLTVLTVAVAVLAAMCAVNLALVLRLSAIVREVKATGGQSRPELLVGDRLPEFAPIETLDGGLVAREQLQKSPTLIGFFTPTCAPCHEAMPDFATAAQQLLTYGGRAVAMVRVHRGDDLDETLERLQGCQVHLIHDGDTELMQAFKVAAFPTVLRFEGGSVAATSIDAVGIKHLAHA